VSLGERSCQGGAWLGFFCSPSDLDSGLGEEEISLVRLLEDEFRLSFLDACFLALRTFPFLLVVEDRLLVLLRLPPPPRFANNASPLHLLLIPAETKGIGGQTRPTNPRCTCC